MPTNVKPIAVEGDGEHVFVLLLNDKTFAFSSTCRRLADIVASVLATPNMKLLLCPPTCREVEPTAGADQRLRPACARQAARARQRARRQAL